MAGWTNRPGIDFGGLTSSENAWVTAGEALADSGALEFVIQSSGELAHRTMVVGEVPSGDVDGVNVTFTLANTPSTGSVILFVNGSRRRSGAGNDYTISGLMITMLSAPLTNSVLLADYHY